jgi:hypothetical protein
LLELFTNLNLTQTYLETAFFKGKDIFLRHFLFQTKKNRIFVSIPRMELANAGPGVAVSVAQNLANDIGQINRKVRPLAKKF